MSISLNGNTANYLSIASALGLDSNVPQTLCGWFKPANTNANKMAWAFLHSDGYTSHCGARFSLTPTINVWGGSGTASASMGAYSADTWYFVYWRRDTASNSGLYGRAASGFSSTTDFADGAYSAAVSTTAGMYTSLQLGKKGADGYPWNGEICCFRVWDSQLTVDELLLEARSATPVKSTGLRANWRLATNTDLTSTVNSYALTANGTVSTGSTEPTEIAGAASQILLPSADITTTGWTSSAGGALYAAIDESVASDSDYIYTGTLDAECEVRLQSGSTPGSGSKNLSVRVPAGFTPVGGWQVSLYQGASLVQSFTSPAPAANTTATFSVTNAITDYSDLRVRIKSTA